MEGIETKIRETAKALFSEKKIDILIGHEKGSLVFHSRPVMIRDANDTERLVWNSFCTNNLAVYLPRFFEPKKPKKGEVPPPLPRVAVIAKGCDARSIIGLVRERQVPRQNLIIIGVPCEGMIDKSKLEKLLEGDFIASGSIKDGGTSITGFSGKRLDIKKEQVLLDACIECAFPVVEDADIAIAGTSRKPATEKYKTAKSFSEKSPAERWRYFAQEISKCIRCYACRQVCPNCYCKECFVEQTNPRWVSAGDDLSEKMVFHIGRVFHQAGRCVECDACVRACPVGIDIRTFTQKVAQDVKEMFDYCPGFSPEVSPPLCAYRLDDRQEFITEP